MDGAVVQDTCVQEEEVREMWETRASGGAKRCTRSCRTVPYRTVLSDLWGWVHHTVPHRTAVKDTEKAPRLARFIYITA